MQTMTMTIDGAWLTDLIRTRFHREGGTIRDARELLRATGVPERALDEVTCGVLEGRLRLENDGDGRMAVVDDDAELPSMLEVAERARHALDLERMALAMETDPLRFCDPWSMPLWDGYVSMMLRERRPFEPRDTAGYEPDELSGMSPTSYLRALLQSRTAYDEDVMSGTWTLEEPELMLDCGFLDATTQSQKDHAWRLLFERTAKRPWLYERHAAYLRATAREDGLVAVVNKGDLASSESVRRPAPYDRRDPQPTEPTQWSGLVAPDGSFHKARFAHHETIATDIVCAREMGQRTGEDALETLLREGWAICRTLPYYPYERAPMLPERLTSEQRRTLKRTEQLEDFED